MYTRVTTSSFLSHPGVEGSSGSNGRGGHTTKGLPLQF